MGDRTVMQSGRYKAYPEYKDSGVEWLGDIPSHWNVKRLGQFFKERRQKVSDKDYPPLSVTMKGIVPQLENAAKTDAGDNRKLVLKNDFVINSRSDRKGSSGVSELDGSVSLISIVLEPKGIVPRYAHHLLRSYNFQEEFYRHGKGIVADLWSTNSSEMKDILIPEISENESNAIASFLDYETAKIDTLIKKQQRLVELLTEKRQAVISHAVTKGLNPDVPMKDSGVEWLGDVPEHWIVTKLRQLAFLQEGPGLRRWQFKAQGIKVISVTNITEAGIDFTRLEKFISHEEYLQSYQHFTVNKGDILLSSSGNSWGKVATYEGDDKVILNTSTIRLNELKHRPLVQPFIKFFLLSEACREQLGLAMTGSCQPNFGPTHLNEVKTVVPPVDEQYAISKYIDEKVSKISELLQVCESTIQLMQERRTALISAAVTGKIDVRDWVKPE